MHFFFSFSLSEREKSNGALKSFLFLFTSAGSVNDGGQTL